MKNIKTYETFSLIPKYFSKENRNKRNRKSEIISILQKLLNSDCLIINNNYYNPGALKVHGVKIEVNKNGSIGNTQLNGGCFNINDDGTIDVYGSVIIRGGDKSSFNGIKFRYIIENFKQIYYYYFDHLPEKVYGNLTLKDCGINSFKELPIKFVKGDVNLSGNNISTFENIFEFNGDLDISSNDIYSMDFFPENFTGDLEFYLNPIINIKIVEQDNKGYDYIGGDDSLISYLVNDIKVNSGYKLELFNDYDPIRPPDSSGKKPIIYLERLNSFLNEVGFKDLLVNNAIKRYYTIK